MSQRILSLLPRYILAFFIVGIATVVTYYTGTLFAATPFALYFAAVALVAWRCGMWPALAASALATFSINFVFLSPQLSARIDIQDVTALCIFFFVAILISYTTNRQNLAEQSTAKVEDRLHQMMNSMDEIFFMIDDEWRITYVNKRFETYTGHSPEQAIGKNMFEQYPEIVGSVYESKYLAALESGQPVLFETPSLNSDSWFQLRVYPSEQGLSIFVTDVSASRITERDLFERKEQLRLALEAAALGDWEWNIQSDELRFSDRARDIFGLGDTESLTLERMLERVHPQDQRRQRKELQDAVERQDDCELEFRLLQTQHSSRWVSARGRVLWEDDQPQRMIGVVGDITQRHQAEAERQELEARFRLMADNAPVLIWMSDTSKECIWFNKPWLEFTGRPLEAELGFGWSELVHPDDVHRCLQVFTESFEARQPFSMEYRMLHYDSTYRWLLDHGVPLLDGAGNFTGYIGSCIDITSRKEFEEQNFHLLEREQRARNEAEEASRLKDEFLATLSHELRTPMNAILGWSHLVRDPRLDEAERNHGLEAIERSAQSQTQLIEDLLDMSRITSGKLQLELQEVRLQGVIQAAVDSVLPAANRGEVRVEAELDPDAGAMQGDPQRLQQIVWNLLANAVKFTPPGGRIVVGLEQLPGALQISVGDNGSGILAEFLPHVFDRFRQQDSSTTRRFGGVGLGLSIVRDLVELHGGAVAAFSDGAGRGARFVVTLPATGVGDGEEPTSGANAPPRISDPTLPKLDLGNLRLLVVDDDEDTLELLQRSLHRRNAHVVTASSADEALQLLQVENFDLLISDIGMPDQDGYTLLRRIRELPRDEVRNLPAIALTAFARGEDREDALEAGYQLHLTKPIEPALLLKSIVALTKSQQDPAASAAVATEAAL